MLSFYFSLSSNARMTLLQELQQILLQQQPPTIVVTMPTTSCAVVAPVPEQPPPRLSKTVLAATLGAKPPKLVKPLVERSPAPLPHVNMLSPRRFASSWYDQSRSARCSSQGSSPSRRPNPPPSRRRIVIATTRRSRCPKCLSPTIRTCPIYDIIRVYNYRIRQNTAWQKALARPKVVLMNGGVYRPTTTTTQARVKPIDPDRRELEVAYFVTPHVTVQELAFPFPEHCKPRGKPHVALDSVGLSSTWVHRPATRKEHS